MLFDILSFYLFFSFQRSDCILYNHNHFCIAVRILHDPEERPEGSFRYYAHQARPLSDITKNLHKDFEELKKSTEEKKFDAYYGTIRKLLPHIFPDFVMLIFVEPSRASKKTREDGL